MSNSIWYLILAILGSSLTLYTFWRKKDGRILLLHLCLSGLIEPLEYFVMILLPGYQYLPQIHSDVWIDNLLGAFVSDFFIVPSVAVVLSAFRLPLVWSFAFSIGFMGIEWLFLSLGIYKHFWWQTIYTGIGIFIYFTIAKKIWTTIQQAKQKNFMIFIFTYFLYLMVFGRFTYIFVHLLHIFKFHIGWFNNPTRDHMAFAEMYGEITAFFVYIGFLLKRYIRMFWLSLLLLGNLILYKSNILQTPSIWNLFLVILLQYACILFVYWMIHFLLKKSHYASHK